MEEIIENDFLKIEIDHKGAELKSVFKKNKQQEILWQGNENWWTRRAPVLFPVVGKLNNNAYKFEGKTYHLPQHGFARDMDFSPIKKSSQEVSFQLKSNSGTLEKYPFHFILEITYLLEKNKLTTHYKVQNSGKKVMHFSIGAHPGFNCPVTANEALSDYFLEFEFAEKLQRHLLENGLFNGKTEIVETVGNKLNLDSSLFEKDAIVLKGLRSKRMILKSRKSDFNLKFSFPGFPYFGIWQKPGAPFLCLEPWCGLADHEGFDDDISQKEGIINLEKNAVFERSFSVEV